MTILVRGLILLVLAGIIASLTLTKPQADPQRSVWRFDTPQGGQFDISYPTTYFATQDYDSKIISFIHTACRANCATLQLAIFPEGDLSQSETITIGNKQYWITKKDTTVTLQPTWTDKLGVLVIQSPEAENQISSDFSQIISSLNFVKEIPPVAVTKTSYTPKPVDTSTPFPFGTPAPPQFVKRLNNWQTGPHNFEEFPPEITNIPDSEVVALDCDQFTISGGSVAGEPIWIYSEKTVRVADQRPYLDLIAKLEGGSDYKVTSFLLCQTEHNQQLITYSMSNKNQPSQPSKFYTSLMDSHQNVLSTTSWDDKASKAGCRYPILYQDTTGLFGSQKVLYLKCISQEGGHIVKVDMLKQRTSIL